MAHKGGRRDRGGIRYDPSIYTPEGAKLLSDKELRAEYSRLRAIARKRLERMGNTEWNDTQVYKLNTETDKETGKTSTIYKPLSEIKNNSELRHLLSDVARFVEAKTSTVKGLEEQRNQAVKTLNERGYDFVNKKNFREFADFMEYSRIANLGRMYDSKRTADFFSDAKVKHKLSGAELLKAYSKWKKHQAKRKKIQHKNPRNSDLYRRDME